MQTVFLFALQTYNPNATQSAKEL